VQFVMFYHSLVSDWNHGNAHFLRGVVSELIARGHQVRVYEPNDGWSLQNLIAQQGEQAVSRFRLAYPHLSSERYELAQLDLDRVLEGANFVIVHEWNSAELVRRLGERRAALRSFRLLFHDTHHRAVTDARAMASYDLSEFDGVLAFGQVIKDIYEREGWAERVWVWHEAADTRVFRPLEAAAQQHDLVFIGNWGDGERTAELHEYLLDPVQSLGLHGRVCGVRYPDRAQRALRAAGLAYGGWLPNYEVPAVYAQFRMTVHVPRRPYAQALPGIPTIRVFEALACGIPLICAPWDDSEHLFHPGDDFLSVRSGAEMRDAMRALLRDPERAQELALHGLRSVLARHTCAHRVDELLAIANEVTA
jgi:spore maturation protein CgeB